MFWERGEGRQLFVFLKKKKKYIAQEKMKWHSKCHNLLFKKRGEKKKKRKKAGIVRYGLNQVCQSMDASLLKPKDCYQTEQQQK